MTAAKQRRTKLSKPKLTLKRYSLKQYVSLLSLVLAAFLLIASFNFVWVRNTLLDTNTWANNTAKFIEQDEVRQEVARTITDTIYDSIELESLVADTLPGKSDLLAVPIAGGIRSYTQEQLEEILDTDEFREVWRKANVVAHGSIVLSVQSLDQEGPSNEESLFFIEEDTVVFNFLPVWEELKSRLRDRGLIFIPETTTLTLEDTTFRIIRIENLDTILASIDILDRASVWTPLLAVMFTVVGLSLARNPRKAVYLVSVYTIVLAVINIQLIRLPTDSLSTFTAETIGISATSSTALYAVLTDAVLTSLIALTLVMLVVLIFSYLLGPSKRADKVRQRAQGLVVRFSNDTITGWIADNSTALKAVIATATVLLLYVFAFSSIWPPVVIVVFAGSLIVLIKAFQAEANR